MTRGPPPRPPSRCASAGLPAPECSTSAWRPAGRGWLRWRRCSPDAGGAASGGGRGERGQLVLADAQGVVTAGRELARALEAVRAANGGPLVDAIRRDPEGHVSRLLATVLWVPELDDALALRAVLPAGWRVVTAAGEVVSADGVVTLGRPDPILEGRRGHERLG